MQIKILFFGSLTDIAGASLVIRDIDDTNLLIKELNQTYPLLKELKYLVAVDQKVIGGNTVLTNGCTVALMPPFSGG